MFPTRLIPSRVFTLSLFTAIFAAWATNGMAQAPIVNPGAPGQPSRLLSADEATRLAAARHSAADTKFMQDMIAHHYQALEMSWLVADRTSRNELIEVANRIEASQKDEIAFMQDWLRERGEIVPDPAAHHTAHTGHSMAGMATREEMTQLEQARGATFDAMFLKLMIKHHKGALTMVEDLLEQDGAVYEPVLFEFTTDITNDQSTEIDRMTVMLAGFSPDPRATLTAGYTNAGEAIWNMDLVTTLARPAGFFDPENPAELPLSVLYPDEEAGYDADATDDDDDTTDDVADDVADGVTDDEDDESRAPLMSFTNTDLAFRDDVLVAGNYHGFNIYDIGERNAPKLLSSVVCPGGQGDVSIVGDLLLMSVEQTRGRLDCGLRGNAESVSEERFRGLRIFDISDLTMPVQVGAVQTCRGSHTHSVVSGPGDDGKIIVYNSGTSSVRDEEEMEGCLDEPPYRDDQTALFRIDVIEIPVDDPASARIIASPTVFADPESGSIAGLWGGGDHGDDTQETSETDHCHDITVFPELDIAAGACSGNGILFDISDPLNPTRIHEVVDPAFAYWHSATFNNDGTKVLFTDEWGGGSRARCRASDPLTWGANAIYDIVDNKLEFRSYYKLPVPQAEQENCVAHNGSIVPVPGRDLFVQAWYQGGISLMDFTDSANPVEIAYFDRGPIHKDELVFGGYWSVYWYDELIYATETTRGLDVLALTPSEFLTQNEIGAALASQGGSVFNPQQQFRIDWPAEPVVARARMDQLQRGGNLSDDMQRELSDALDQAEKVLSAGGTDASLARGRARQAVALRRSGGNSADREQEQFTALGETLDDIAARLR
ncbi:MAG: DUF305 domain-containing protein [Woeseiaceae bacterium]|nr:DUF305 domain-containing protein [Woeseiaceae bacterium]